MVLAGGLEARDDGDLLQTVSRMTVPRVTVPRVTVPRVTVPRVTVPRVKGATEAVC